MIEKILHFNPSYDNQYRAVTRNLEKLIRKINVKTRYYFDEISKKGIFFVSEGESVDLGGNLPYILSLPAHMEGGTAYESKYCVDVFQFHRILYIYSDLGQPISVGEGVYPFIQSATLKTGDELSSVRNIVYQNPIFIPLQSHHIITISFSIRNSLGEKIKFLGSSPTTVCKLLFKYFP